MDLFLLVAFHLVGHDEVDEQVWVEVEVRLEAFLELFLPVVDGAAVLLLFGFFLFFLALSPHVRVFFRRLDAEVFLAELVVLELALGLGHLALLHEVLARGESDAADHLDDFVDVRCWLEHADDFGLPDLLVGRSAASAALQGSFLLDDFCGADAGLELGRVVDFEVLFGVDDYFGDLVDCDVVVAEGLEVHDAAVVLEGVVLFGQVLVELLLLALQLFLLLCFVALVDGLELAFGALLQHFLARLLFLLVDWLGLFFVLVSGALRGVFGSLSRRAR